MFWHDQLCAHTIPGKASNPNKNDFINSELKRECCTSNPRQVALRCGTLTNATPAKIATAHAAVQPSSSAV